MHIRIKEKLSKLRTEKGWSREEAAKQAKVPFTAYESYEKFNRTPSGEYAISMAKAFEVTVEYLLDDVKGYPPSRTDRLSGAGTHPDLEDLDTSVLHGKFQDYFAKHPAKLAMLSQADLQELAKTFEYGGEALNIESCVNKLVAKVEEARGYCEISKSSWVVEKKNHKKTDERVKQYKEGLGNQPREMMVTSINMMLEFILVALIVGTLSVTALPKFMTLTSEAEIGVARGITGTLRSSISILHSRVLFGGIDTYDATDIVAVVEAHGVTFDAGEGVITATFASKHEYTWSMEGPTLPETMATLTPNF